MIPSIILGALLVLYICEGIPYFLYSGWYASPIDFGLEVTESPIPGIKMDVLIKGAVALFIFIIVLVVRSAFSLIIAVLINKISYFPQSSNPNVNDLLRPMITNKYNIIRLFVLSILIIGIPTSQILVWVTRFLDIHTYNIDPMYMDTTVITYLDNPLSLPLTYILIDIARISILVWITTKPFVKGKLNN